MKDITQDQCNHHQQWLQLQQWYVVAYNNNAHYPHTPHTRIRTPFMITTTFPRIAHPISLRTFTSTHEQHSSKQAKLKSETMSMWETRELKYGIGKYLYLLRPIFEFSGLNIYISYINSKLKRDPHVGQLGLMVPLQHTCLYIHKQH